MSVRCSHCKEVILDNQDRIKCSGACSELFHLACAEANGYRDSTVLLNQANDSFEQGVNNESQCSLDNFKGLSENYGVAEHDMSKLKKDLRDLLTENDILKSKNVLLENRVKILESKVNLDNKMFDEFKKILRNLSKKVDENNEVVEEIKDDLKQVRAQNNTLENENEGLTRQIHVLEDRVNYLQRCLKSLSDKRVVQSGVVAKGDTEGATIRESAGKIHDQDQRIVSMIGSKQKYRSYAVDAMANKPVTALAGIGSVYGERLCQQGYYKASQIYEKFLSLNKNRGMFQSWLSSVCGANSKWSDHCYQCLNDWNINFDGGFPHQVTYNSQPQLEFINF